MFLLSHEGSETVRVKHLNDLERELIKRNSVIGSASFGSKQALLGDIHKDNLWIECDCRSLPSPVVGVRLRDKYYHLFNMNKRGEHEKFCPLHRLPSDIKRDNEAIKAEEKKKNSFVFHYEGRETKPSELNKIGGAKPSKSENSLWVCLRRIFRLSGIDTFGGNLPLDGSVRRREALKVIREIRLGGVSMAKVSRWGLAKHNDLCELITKVTEEQGMPKGAAHGLMFATIDAIQVDDDKNIILCCGEDKVIMPRSASIEINGRQGFEFSPPYFAIYTVMNTSEKDEEVICEPCKCFITPIHSIDSLIPISNELERAIINKAIANVEYNRKKGNKLQFKRPLYPYISPVSERRVLPTISVKSGECEVFIDIKYQVNEENRDMMERRLDAMREITDIIEVELKENEEDFEKEVFKSVSNAAKYVLGLRS